MRAHLSVMRAIFQQALDDPAMPVKMEALKALGVLTGHLDDQATFEWFQAALEPMLGALSACVVGQGDGDVAIQVLDVLEELADDPNDILQAKLAPIVSSVLAIAVNPNVRAVAPGHVVRGRRRQRAGDRRSRWTFASAAPS